ncbi:LysR family transcriptional regulator [Kiloniella laminariae]|uniref:LysR family transcriptional regulator n=1 Tax=Kiloniella laminariae TaxID=454162 RepID=UPI000477B887|nr:LysR family transcriptional regulator [Kiloniella laminariae]
MNRNLDLGTLRSFVAVADTGGMTSAANRLHLTQSTVSMQIKRLEEGMGLSLFDRNSGRGIRPTAEGEQLLGYARSMLEMNDEVWGRLTAPKFEGSLSFGVPGDIIRPHTPNILRQFNRDFPRVKVKLTTAGSLDLIAGVDRGQHDLVLTTEVFTKDEKLPANAERLAVEQLVWTGAVGGRAWLARPLPLAFVRWCVFRQPTISALEQAGISWFDAVDSESHEPTSVTTAADFAVRAEMPSFDYPGLEAIDHRGELPLLPKCSINLYVTEGPNHKLAQELAVYVRRAFRG